MLYIGVDLGTSAVKLLLMDGEGKIKEILTYVAIALIPYIISIFISINIQCLFLRLCRRRSNV